MDLVGALAWLALTLVAYVAWLRPVLDRGVHERVRREQLSRLQAEASGLSARLAELEAELAEARTTLQQSPARLRSARNVNHRLTHLADLAAASSLKVDQVQPGFAGAAGSPEMVPIRLSGYGSFRRCVEFLRQLRQDLPDMSITAFELTGKPASVDPAGQTRFQFDLLWRTEAALRVAAK